MFIGSSVAGGIRAYLPVRLQFYKGGPPPQEKREKINVIKDENCQWLV
jgi:hypothetical protein